MLRVLAWCGVRWAARRLDRKRFARPYMLAAKLSRRRRALSPLLWF
jgi:hypothetical protein